MKKRIEKDLVIDLNPPAKNGLSFDELEKMMIRWQNKLDMNNWKMDLKIVDFQKDNGFRQSGHFIANIKEKTATILLTWNPWREDEEYTLVHEMVHVLVYDFDKYCEDIIKEDTRKLGVYFEKLENSVHHITRIVLGRDHNK